MIHLDLDDLLHVARRVLRGDVEVRDYGLLESALARLLPELVRIVSRDPRKLPLGARPSRRA